MIQRPESGFDLRRFGRPDESTSLKKAKVYNEFTELLLRENCRRGISNGTLLTDRMTRAAEDTFLTQMSVIFLAEPVAAIQRG